MDPALTVDLLHIAILLMVGQMPIVVLQHIVVPLQAVVLLYKTVHKLDRMGYVLNVHTDFTL